MSYDPFATAAPGSFISITDGIALATNLQPGGVAGIYLGSPAQVMAPTLAVQGGYLPLTYVSSPETEMPPMGGEFPTYYAHMTVAGQTIEEQSIYVGNDSGPVAAPGNLDISLAKHASLTTLGILDVASQSSVTIHGAARSSFAAAHPFGGEGAYVSGVLNINAEVKTGNFATDSAGSIRFGGLVDAGVQVSAENLELAKPMRFSGTIDISRPGAQVVLDNVHATSATYADDVLTLMGHSGRVLATLDITGSGGALFVQDVGHNAVISATAGAAGSIYAQETFSPVFLSQH